MNAPSGKDVQQALETITGAGYEWAASDGEEIKTHLGRHAPTQVDQNLTVGSKFSAGAWEDMQSITQLANDLCMIELAKCITEGKPMRAEIALAYPNAGIDGVANNMARSRLQILTETKIVRDPGTPYEQEVAVSVVSPDQALPSCDKISIIGGAYGPTKKLGLYTIFPGEAGKPFPKEQDREKDPEGYAANRAYWIMNRFVATPQEALHALDVSVQMWKESPGENAARIAGATTERARISELASHRPGRAQTPKSSMT